MTSEINKHFTLYFYQQCNFIFQFIYKKKKKKKYNNMKWRKASILNISKQLKLYDLALLRWVRVKYTISFADIPKHTWFVMQVHVISTFNFLINSWNYLPYLLMWVGHFKGTISISWIIKLGIKTPPIISDFSA